MGAGVSAGENNDDLIDNLRDANYIKTDEVERVFRAVDRGSYFLPEPPTDAYRDVAWKNGNFHISAPCIYSEVMEGLNLKPGLSFLNLGSGTGYLSTVVGLILGSNGINHGIELHEDVIEYANKRLNQFKTYSGAVDEYDFCEPKFMQGNCLCLASDYHLYDRVYCGAACPEKYLGHIKNLIKIGGILVIPINERLVQMKRESETSWTTNYLLPVSFTTLVKPERGTEEIVPCFDIEPLSLQELCRATIRNLLRKNIETEHPELRDVKKRRKTSKKKKPGKRDRYGRRDTPRGSEELLDFFLLTIARKKKRVNGAATRERANSSSSANNEDTDEGSSDSDDSSFKYPLGTLNVLDKTNESNAAASTSNNDAVEASSSKQNVEQREIDSKVIVHRENEDETDNKNQTDTSVSYNVTSTDPMIVEEVKEEIKNSNVETQRKSNRDKFDSGLGDELLLPEPVEMESPSTSSDEEDQETKRYKRGLKEKDKRLSSKWRKVDRVYEKKSWDNEESSENDVKSDSESEYVEKMRIMKMYISPYSMHMKDKIQQLPLPVNVKKFLNFYRQF